MLSNIFGDKSWYKSLTAWGLVVMAGLTSALTVLCADGVSLIGVELCETLTSVFLTVGGVMTALGLRKAAN